MRGANVTVNAHPRAGRRQWAGLAVLALPTMLLSLDLSVLFLAVPHLSADLGASSTEQLWITDVYGFMTAGFLITMGTLGDRIGRRRLLLIGAATFGAASVVAAYSTSPEMLIISRAALGIAGATLLPSTLALIRQMFHDPKQMGVAIAGWTTAYMAGVALGPVVGGVMLEYFWWGSVFLLGVPIMLLLLVTGPAILPEARDPAAGRLDLTSVVLSLAAILPIIYGLKDLARYGWELTPILAIVVGVILGVVFVVRQRRLASPLLDLRLFGIATVRATLVMAMLVAALQNGSAFLVTVFLQMVEGLSPLATGLWMVVPAVALVLTINATPRLAGRIPPGQVFAGGLAVSAVGYLLLSRVNSAGSMALLMVAVVIVFAGIGPAGALTNQLVLGAAPPERAGTAASMTSTSGEFGIAFGIATLGSLATAVYRGQVDVPPEVPAEPSAAAQESVVGAVAAAERLGGGIGAQLLDNAREAFTTALNTVASVSTVLYLGAALVALITLRHVRPTGEAPAAPEPTESGSEPQVAADQLSHMARSRKVGRAAAPCYPPRQRRHRRRTHHHQPPPVNGPRTCRRPARHRHHFQPCHDLDPRPPHRSRSAAWADPSTPTATPITSLLVHGSD